MAERLSGLSPYVPTAASSWDTHAPGARWRAVNGTLVFVDISGFTSLSERLARRGRIGAEELTSVLDRVFRQMLEVVYDRGGSLLKFGGDALLTLFDTDDHLLQACAAAVEMRSTLRLASREKTSVGRIDLKMSSGIHTGAIDFFLVGDSHRELIVTGPAATTTAEMEKTAGAGEIMVSAAVAAQLPASFLGERKGSGWLLRKRMIAHPPCGVVYRSPADEADLSSFVPIGLREQLKSGVDDSEHRIATVGFVQFKGVDELLASEQPEYAAEKLHTLVKTVQYAVDSEAVTFLASDIDTNGGKIILASGIPSSRHDDEGRMLRATRQILDSDLDLDIKFGVNRGHVFSGNVGMAFRRTYTVMGDTVNLAARLMASADPSKIYAAPNVLNLSSTLFRTEPIEPFYVKGKEQPVHAFAVFEETGVRPPVLTTELPFRGRDAEIGMIVGIVNTCSRSGQGGMMTISGATGVGKTRLIAEVLEQCSGMDTLMVQAEPTGIDNPYWAFRDPMRRELGIERASQADMAKKLSSAVMAMAPELEWSVPLLGDVMHIQVEDNQITAAIDPRFRPDQTAEAVVELLSTYHSSPLALVAEDGQWLDEASMALLAYLGKAASERPWTILVTTRTESDFEPMGDQIVLSPLDDGVVRAIAIETTQGAPLRPHELESIVARADGNPLFLGEILRMLAETGTADELPDSLDAVISREVDTLPPLTRQVLRYSSVLGSSFRRVVLNGLLAPENIELDGATKTELERFLAVDRGRMRFRHAVVHDVAYQGLSYSRRRDLHARAGQVIEKLAGDDPETVAESLAAHYAEAGIYDKAWRYSRIAADRAKHAYANTEAATHYQRAIEAARHLEAVDPSAVSEAWVRLGDVRELAGQMEAAREALSQALRVGTEDPVSRSDIYLRRAGTWLNSGDLAQAKRSITLGRRGLDPHFSRAHLSKAAELDAFEASVYATEGDPAKAAASAERAVERAIQSNQEEALARAYGVLDWANFMLGIDQPRRGPQAIAIYQRLGHLERSVNVMNNLGAFAYLEGDWDDAVTWYEKSLDAAQRSGNVLDAALAKTNVAEVLIGQGRYEEAVPLLEEVRRVYEASNAHHFMPLVGLLEARAQIGLGNIGASLEGLRSLLADQGNGQETPWTGETMVALADALIRDGRSEQARELIQRVESGGRAGRSSVTRLKALAEASHRNHWEAEVLLREAAELAREDGELYEELLATQALTEMIGRAGEDPDPTDHDRLETLRQALGVVAIQFA